MVQELQLIVHSQLHLAGIESVSENWNQEQVSCLKDMSFATNNMQIYHLMPELFY